MLKATLVIEGDPEAVADLICLVTAQTELLLHWRFDQLFEQIDWVAHPSLLRLSKVEREIMRLDLAHEPRRRIAQALKLTVGTVTVYRRSIRAKLRGQPHEQYPQPVREWLRRFPGQAAAASAIAPEQETAVEPKGPDE